MTARTIVRGSIAAMALSVLPACTDDAPAVQSAESVRPNVILIETDDMRTDDLQAMPQTRELLGARYTNAYVSTPLCCPSRATLLTGQYAHNNGVHDNAGTDGGAAALDDSETLPVWLHRSGYQTVMLGKYLNLYGSPEQGGTAPDYLPPGWDKFAAVTYPGGGNYTDFQVNDNGTLTDVVDDYQTTYFGKMAVRQVEMRAPRDEPMFMWLSFHAPHSGGGNSPQKYVPSEPQYAGDSKVGLPKSPAVDEAIVADKPPWIRSLPRLTDRVKQNIVTERRERRDALRSVDDQVAAVVGALRDSGELDNTVIMFTSDNGFMQGEHRLADDKTVPYLESARVPLLIGGPGFTSGLHPAPVSNVDLAPTVADLAGVTPGLPVDGMSLLDPIPADRPILLEYLGDDADIDVPPYSGVIQNGAEYVEYDGGQRELYDLAVDPWQLRNRAGDAALRSVRTSLAAELDRLRHCKGGEFR